MRGIATIGVIGASLAVWLPDGAVAAGDVHYCSQVLSPYAYCNSASHGNVSINRGTATGGGWVCLNFYLNGDSGDPVGYSCHTVGLYQCFGTTPLTGSGRTRNGLQDGAHNAYADHSYDAHLDIGTGC